VFTKALAFSIRAGFSSTNSFHSCGAFLMSFVPTWFFFWGPVAVAAFFMYLGVYGQRIGVVRSLEADWSGYSAEDVGRAMHGYGEAGRLAYRQRILTADAVFAFFYAVVGGVIGLGLAMRGIPGWVAILCGGPWVLAGIADICENIALARLAERFPKISPALVALCSSFTRVKILLFLLGILGAIYAFYLAAQTHL
jgi:hypothetical protein